MAKNLSALFSLFLLTFLVPVFADRGGFPSDEENAQAIEGGAALINACINISYVDMLVEVDGKLAKKLEDGQGFVKILVKPGKHTVKITLGRKQVIETKEFDLKADERVFITGLPNLGKLPYRVTYSKDDFMAYYADRNSKERGNQWENYGTVDLSK